MMGKPYASLVEFNLSFDFTFFHSASRPDGRAYVKLVGTHGGVESKFILMLRSVIAFAGHHGLPVYRSACQWSPPAQMQMRLRIV